jgi:ubiquinone/menaquinone biosynthesis C-methylase UbiE
MPKPDAYGESALQLPAALLECGHGTLPPNLALMHLIIDLPTPEAVDRAIANATGASADLEGRRQLAILRGLWRTYRDGFTTIRTIANLFDHHDSGSSPDTRIAACAEAFDAAAELSADAGAALYSLGSNTLLQAITREIVERMRDWRLLGREKTALEIGCGSGRFIAALAPEMRRITGVDISARMIAAAKRRCARHANVRLLQTEGRDLAFCRDGSIAFLYAVDSFPYIVQCGAEMAARHFAEAARVLRTGGRFLILNYAYDSNPARDRAEIQALAEAAGLRLLRASTGDFSLWDGATFILERPLPEE